MLRPLSKLSAPEFVLSPIFGFTKLWGTRLNRPLQNFIAPKNLGSPFLEPPSPTNVWSRRMRCFWGLREESLRMGGICSGPTCSSRYEQPIGEAKWILLWHCKVTMVSWGPGAGVANPASWSKQDPGGSSCWPDAIIPWSKKFNIVKAYKGRPNGSISPSPPSPTCKTRIRILETSFSLWLFIPYVSLLMGIIKIQSDLIPVSEKFNICNKTSVWNRLRPISPRQCLLHMAHNGCWSVFSKHWPWVKFTMWA